jgi:hypothetical protein
LTHDLTEDIIFISKNVVSLNNMNKQKYLILFSVIFLGLFFSFYQYFNALKTDFVSAVTVGTPSSLCVDTTGNMLGIGTNTPNEKLTVAGNLSITGSMTGGTVPWTRLGTFPSACPSGQYVSGVGSSLTCATPENSTNTDMLSSFSLSVLDSWEANQNFILFICPATGHFTYSFKANSYSAVTIYKNTTALESVTNGNQSVCNGRFISCTNSCVKGDVVHLNMGTVATNGVVNLFFAYTQH